MDDNPFRGPLQATQPTAARKQYGFYWSKKVFWQT
jgi:hypothetical protein